MTSIFFISSILEKSEYKNLSISISLHNLKFSKSDIVSSIRENYSKENIKYISNYLFSDNKYLEKAKVFDSNLKNIKSSIEENGVYKPFYVNYKDNKYEVIIGRK